MSNLTTTNNEKLQESCFILFTHEILAISFAFSHFTAFYTKSLVRGYLFNGLLVALTYWILAGRKEQEWWRFDKKFPFFTISHQHSMMSTCVILGGTIIKRDSIQDSFLV